MSTNKGFRSNLTSTHKKNKTVLSVNTKVRNSPSQQQIRIRNSNVKLVLRAFIAGYPQKLGSRPNAGKPAAAGSKETSSLLYKRTALPPGI
jgi:hypothetical protein